MLGPMLLLMIEGGVFGPLAVPDGPVRLRLLSSRTLKRGDTRPYFRGQIVSHTGAPIPLPEDATARILAQRQGTTVVSEPCTITDHALGIVEYAWRPKDLAVVGALLVEVELQDTEGGVLTAPSKGWAELDVDPDLG